MEQSLLQTRRRSYKITMGIDRINRVYTSSSLHHHPILWACAFINAVIFRFYSKLLSEFDSSSAAAINARTTKLWKWTKQSIIQVIHIDELYCISEVDGVRRIRYDFAFLGYRGHCCANLPRASSRLRTCWDQSL